MHALSIPTWIVHVSSVLEWIAAIWFIWQYAEVSGHLAWRALSFGMLPALISAMCACTWHFFDNSTALSWLVTLQAAMTVVGNCTACAAAWWIWKQSKGLPSRVSPRRNGAQLSDGQPQSPLLNGGPVA